VINLYFLKLKRENFVISSTLLWRRCIDEMRVNSPFQRLRRNLLLLLQIIILALLVLALARPFRAAEGILGHNIILLLDNSASMSATDVKPNRLEQARRKLYDLLQARSDAQTAIVVYAGSAHTLVPLSDDLATSGNLLEALRPSIMPEPGHRADLAVEKALGLLNQAGRHSIVKVGSAEAASILAGEIVPPVGLDEVPTPATVPAMVEAAARIIDSVPVSRLDLLPDPGFWPIIARQYNLDLP
jgi:hypothetical protein